MHICTLHRSVVLAQLSSLPRPDASKYLSNVSDCSKCADKLVNLTTEGEFAEKYPLAAKKILDKAVDISRSIASPYDLTFTLCVFGEMNGIWGNYEIAESAFTEALANAKEYPEAEGLVDSIFINLANIQQDRNRQEAARDTLLGAVEYAITKNDPLGQAEALANLANVYQDLHDYENAVAVRKQSLDLYRQLGDKEAEIDGLSNLALIYADMKNISAAVLTGQKAIAMVDSVGDSIGAARALNNLGLVLQVNGEKVGAKTAFQTATALARRAGDVQLSKIAKQNLANMDSK